MRVAIGYVILALLFVPYVICVGGCRLSELMDSYISRLHVWMRPHLYRGNPPINYDPDDMWL
jgi:hypothetical protein